MKRDPHAMALELNRMVYELNAHLMAMTSEGIEVKAEVSFRNGAHMGYKCDLPVVRASASTGVKVSM